MVSLHGHFKLESGGIIGRRWLLLDARVKAKLFKPLYGIDLHGFSRVAGTVRLKWMAILVSYCRGSCC